MVEELQLIDRLIDLKVFNIPQYSQIPKIIMSNGTGVKLPRSLTAPTPIPAVITTSSELDSIETVVRAAAVKIFQTSGTSSTALPVIPTIEPTAAVVPKPARKKHARYNPDHISFFNAIPPQQSSSITTEQFYKKFPDFQKSRESIQKRLKHATDSRGNCFFNWVRINKYIGVFLAMFLLFFCCTDRAASLSGFVSPSSNGPSLMIADESNTAASILPIFTQSLPAPSNQVTGSAIMLLSSLPSIMPSNVVLANPRAVRVTNVSSISTHGIFNYFYGSTMHCFWLYSLFNSNHLFIL